MEAVWYHGSPLELTVLRAGSTVTQDRELARVFSHKPTLVEVSDEGAIRHNGTAPGFLYRVAERVEPGDIRPHPRTSMQAGKEWLTTRDLRLALVAPTELRAEEFLSEEQVRELLERHSPPQ